MNKFSIALNAYLVIAWSWYAITWSSHGWFVQCAFGLLALDALTRLVGYIDDYLDSRIRVSIYH